jgi:hypothetical protein
MKEGKVLIRGVVVTLMFLISVSPCLCGSFETSSNSRWTTLDENQRRYYVGAARTAFS